MERGVPSCGCMRHRRPDGDAAHGGGSVVLGDEERKERALLSVEIEGERER